MEEARKKFEALKQQLQALQLELEKLRAGAGTIDAEELEAAANEKRAQLAALSASLVCWDNEAQKLKGQVGAAEDDLKKERGEAAGMQADIKKLVAVVDAIAPEVVDSPGTLRSLAQLAVDKSGQIIVLGVLLAILYAVIYERGVIPKLADATFARGLITFIICLGTIGLAFFLAYQAFAMRDEAADNAFRRAREVFTGLMGVLGTIVGFYFGSADKPAAPLQVAAPKLAGTQLTSYVGGGVPPYRYVIKSTEKDFEEISRSTDGWILETLPKVPGAGSTLKLEVADKRDERAAVKLDLPK